VLEQELRRQAASLQPLAEDATYARLVELADELNEMLASPGERATVEAAVESHTDESASV
jgi:hypothetical protein